MHKHMGTLSNLHSVRVVIMVCTYMFMFVHVCALQKHTTKIRQRTSKDKKSPGIRMVGAYYMIQTYCTSSL